MNDPVDLLSDLGVLVLTCWGEARNQGQEGIAAVAWVMKNRASRPKWWGRTIREVCLKPQQFSCWNEADPNRAKMLAQPLNSPTLQQIQGIVERVLGGTYPDPTGGADHYHTAAISPAWASSLTVTTSIGDHVFYRS